MAMTRESSVSPGGLDRGRRPPAALALALGVWAVAPLLYLAVRAHRGTLSGATGPFAADQLNYLGWIRESSRWILGSNLYDARPNARVYLHPMFAASGVLLRAGVPIQAAWLLWLPVAAVVLFVGFDALVRELAGTDWWSRRAALALGLFAASPVPAALALAGHRAASLTVLSLSGDTQSANELWGYLPGAIALGLTPLVLIAMHRALRPNGEGDGAGWKRYAMWGAAGGFLAAWLHPWQGELLLGILGLAFVAGGLRHAERFAVPAAATLAPILYYLVLARDVPAWSVAAHNLAGHRPSLWVLAAAIGPLALLAALGVERERWGSPLERMVLLWPPVAVAVYFISPTFPSHSLEGIGLPLGLLAVRGVGRVRQSGLPGRRGIAGACVAALIALVLPAVVHTASFLRDALSARNQPYVLAPDEAAAFRFLHSTPTRGAVLARVYLGEALPAFTGRNTWVGHPSWTPDFYDRSHQADELLAGRLTAASARRLVLEADVRFVLADCDSPAGLDGELNGLVAGTRQFGCVTVYQLVPQA